MSLTDYRKLIELHGGNYIGVECNDGTTIEIGYNGESPLHVSSEIVNTVLIPRLQEKMRGTLGDGFNKFDLVIGRSLIELNFYDAGLLLDALRGCVDFIA